MTKLIWAAARIQYKLDWGILEGMLHLEPRMKVVIPRKIKEPTEKPNQA